MNNLLNWFTKKRLIYGFLIMVFVYIISYFNRALELPYFFRSFCCVDDRTLNLFLIFIPVFIFSVIFIHFDEVKFKSWEKFTFVYLLIYLLIYLLSPTQGNGYIWFQREMISFLGSIFYSIISLFLIIYKSLKKE